MIIESANQLKIMNTLFKVFITLKTKATWKKNTSSFLRCPIFMYLLKMFDLQETKMHEVGSHL